MKIRSRESLGQRISENVKIRNRQKGASDMDEKKMLDLLRKQAEEIEPPESLFAGCN